MDPNATLRILRFETERLIRLLDSNDPANAAEALEVADTVAEAFSALDGWLSSGGFQPAWER